MTVNVIDNVSLGIEFINSSVNPGGGGVIPQTGDFYAISLIAIFCVCLLTLSIFMLVKRKSILCGTHIKQTEVSKITKFMISPTAIVLFISIIISCSIINTTKALANINDANNVDIKPDKISVVIDEGSDTINDVVFDFVNNSDNYYLFDKTTIMELDSEVAGLTSPNDWSIQLTALETELYNGAPDGREYVVPENVVTLYPGQSAHATLKFNKGTAELAKKLVGKNVFNLTMIPDQQVAKAPEPKTDLVYNGIVQNAFDALETDAYSITTGSAKDADLYTAVVTLKPDYKWPDKSTDPLHIEWSLSKLPAILTWDSDSLEYSGKLIHPEAIISNKIQLDEVDVSSYEIPDPYDGINAGQQEVIAKSLTGKDSNNYIINEVSLKIKNYTITKKALIITADNKEKDLGDAKDPELTATFDGLVEGETFVKDEDYQLWRETGQEVVDAQFAIHVKVLDASIKAKNYQITTTDGVLVIVDNKPTISPNSSSKTYGQDDPTLTAEVTKTEAEHPLVAGSDFTLSRVIGEDYGQYKITVLLNEESANVIYYKNKHGIRLNEDLFTINKYSVPITWDAFSGSYNGEVQHPTATLTKAKDTDDVSINAYAPTDNTYDLTSAGTQKVKIGELKGDSAVNYSLDNSSNEFEYTIDKADIAFTFSVSGGKVVKPRNYENITLTGTYDVTFGPEASEQDVTYQWYISDSLTGEKTAITGATSSTYTVGKDAYIGQKFYFLKVSISTTNTNFNNASKQTTDDQSVKFVYSKMSFNDQQNITTVLYTYYGTNKLFDAETGTVEKNIPTLSKEGYIMNGWFTETTSGNMVVNYNNELVKNEVSGFVSNNGTWANVEEKTLYAHFSQPNYLTFTNLGSGSNAISFNFTSTNKSALEPLLLWYSTDLKEWKSYEGISTGTEELAVLDASTKTKVYVCGTNPNGFSDENRWGTFSSTDNYKIEGSYGALTDPLGSGALTVPNDYCFQKLFKGSNKLISVPKVDISFTDEQPNCLNEMFMNCSSINYLEVGFKSWPTNGFKDWVTGLAERGTFICPSELEWKCDGSKNNRGDFCPKEFNNGKGEARFWLEQLADASFKAHFYVGDEESHEGYTICPIDNDSDYPPFPFDAMDTTSIVATDNFIEWTSNLRSLNSWFATMSKLSSLDISKWNTSNVTNFRYTFSGMSVIEEIDIHSWNFDKVKDTFTMFADCNMLERIISDNDLDLSKKLTVDKSKFMFNSCTKLPNWCGTTDSTMAKSDLDGGYFFAYSRGYMNIDVDGKALFFTTDDRPATENDFAVPLNSERPEDITWYDYRTQIIEVKGTSNFKTFFQEYVRSMQCWFKQAINLVTADLSGWNTINIKIIHECFFRCYSLKNLILDLDTTNLEYGSYAFGTCTSLEEIDISNWNIERLIDCEGMFRYCTNLSKIYCREDTDWSKSEVLINSYTMFGGCSSLPGYSIEKAMDKTMAKPTIKGGYFTIKTSDSTISSSDENSGSIGEIPRVMDSWSGECRGLLGDAPCHALLVRRWHGVSPHFLV